MEKTLAMLQEGQAALKNNLPGVMEKFQGFAGAVLQEGILSKEKVGFRCHGSGFVRAIMGCLAHSPSCLNKLPSRIPGTI